MQLNLADVVRRAYGTAFVEVLRVQVRWGVEGGVACVGGWVWPVCGCGCGGSVGVVACVGVGGGLSVGVGGGVVFMTA